MIPKSKFKEGYELSKKNAARIIAEGKYLFNQECFASACYLGFLGIEEIGKAMLFLKYWERNSLSNTIWKKQFKNHITKLDYSMQIIVRYINEIHRVMPRISTSDEPIKLLETHFKGIGEVHQLAKMWSVFVDYDFTRNIFIYPDDLYISVRLLSYANMLFDEGSGYTEMTMHALLFYEKDVLDSSK